MWLLCFGFAVDFAALCLVRVCLGRLWFVALDLLFVYVVFDLLFAVVVSIIVSCVWVDWCLG